MMIGGGKERKEREGREEGCDRVGILCNELYIRGRAGVKQLEVF